MKLNIIDCIGNIANFGYAMFDANLHTVKLSIDKCCNVQSSVHVHSLDVQSIMFACLVVEHRTDLRLLAVTSFTPAVLLLLSVYLFKCF